MTSMTRPRPLALSITLLLMAGCSGNQDAANAQHSREPTADKAPASTPTKTDVVSHYADLAHATFQDAVTTAEVLDEAVDTLIAEPTEPNIQQPCSSRPSRHGKPGSAARRQTR